MAGPRRKPVQTVNQVHRVCNAHDPEDCQETADRRSEDQFSLPEEIGQKFDSQAPPIHQSGNTDLHDKLQLRRQIFQIINHTQQIHQCTACHHAQNLRIETQECCHGNHRSQKDRHAAESWYRMGVHSSSVFRYINRTDFICQLDCHRRKRHGNQKCQNKDNP